MSNPTLTYAITKIGEENGKSVYKMTYAISADEPMLVQRQNLCVQKEDADGTKTIQRIEMQPLAIASLALTNLQEPTKTVRNGFHINVSSENLAVGGTYYEISEMVGTYSPPVSSSEEDELLLNPSETVEPMS